jgi:hypothetical protein
VRNRQASGPSITSPTKKRRIPLLLAAYMSRGWVYLHFLPKVHLQHIAERPTKKIRSWLLGVHELVSLSCKILGSA